MINFYEKYDDLIIFNELKSIDFTKSLHLQKFELNEDLLQMKCNKIIIDVGWYPSFDVDGCFKIMVVENENWESCLEIIAIKNILEIEIILKKLIQKYCFK